MMLTSFGVLFLLLISMTGPFQWKKKKGKEKSCSNTFASVEESIKETASASVPSTSVQVEERSQSASGTQLSIERQSEAGPSQPIRRRGKTRGIALEKLNAAMGCKIVIEIDPSSGRPENRQQAKHLQTLIGIAAREDAPMETDFRLKDEDLRGCFDRIESLANVTGLHDDARVYDAIKRRLGKQIKEERYRTKKRYDKVGNEAKPRSMSIDRWESHTKRWSSSKFNDTSKRNKDTRSNCVKKHHTTGATSFAVIRKEISDKELDGAQCGPILLYHRSHYNVKKGRWGSDSAHSSFVKMTEMRDASIATSTPVDEKKIVDTVLGNGNRTDYEYGLGYGHIPKRTGERRKHVSQDDLEAAIHAAEDAMREKMTTEMDAKVASINQGWQQKFQQQEQMMQTQIDQMKSWICNIMKTQNNLPNEQPGFTQSSSSMPIPKQKGVCIDESDEDEEDSEEEDDSDDDESDDD